MPVTVERRPALARTRLGAGVLAGARAAMPGGNAGDLLTWLRTPGRLRDPDLADALEARVRRGETRPDEAAAEPRRTASTAAGRRDPALTGALDRLADAAGAGVEALLDALVAEAEAIWTAPHLRAAAVLGPDEAADARAAAAVRGAADELRGARRLGPGARGRRRRRRSRRSPRCAVREPAVPGGVLVADPLAIRARRFRAVFVCALQEGIFPRHPLPEPFLDDAARIEPRQRERARAALATRTSSRASATCCTRRCRGPRRCCSSPSGRPTRRATRCSRRRSSTTCAALLTDELWQRRGRRLLSEVTWPAAAAPTPHELRRARAAEEERPDPPPLGSPRERRGAGAARGARDRGRPRARDLRGLRRALARGEPAASAADRAGPRADAPRLDRPRRAGADAAAACASARARRG